MAANAYIEQATSFYTHLAGAEDLLRRANYDANAHNALGANMQNLINTSPYAHAQMMDTFANVEGELRAVIDNLTQATYAGTWLPSELHKLETLVSESLALQGQMRQTWDAYVPYLHEASLTPPASMAHAFDDNFTFVNGEWATMADPILTQWKEHEIAPVLEDLTMPELQDSQAPVLDNVTDLTQERITRRGEGLSIDEQTLRADNVKEQEAARQSILEGLESLDETTEIQYAPEDPTIDGPAW